MSDSYLIDYLHGLPEAFAVFGMMFASVIILWFFRNAMTPYNDHEKFGHGITALAIERGSYLLALVIAQVYAVFGYDPDDVGHSLLTLAWKDGFILVTLVVLGFLVDWATVPKIKNDDLLLENNYAVAIAMAGSYLGLGFVLGAATVGEADSLAQSILSTIVFALIGQLVVIALIRLFLLRLDNGHDVTGELTRGNVAVGIDLASFALAISVVVSVGLSGDISSWLDAFQAFGATLLFGLVLLAIVQMVVHRLVTRRSSVTAVRREGNLALVSLIGIGRIGLAVAVWAVLGAVV